MRVTEKGLLDMEIWGEFLGSGVVPALIGAIVAVFVQGLNRNQTQKLSRLDRSFEIKFARYTEYLDAIESLLRTIYQFEERGIDPQAEGYTVDEIPGDILKARRSLLVFAPDKVQKAIREQLKLITPAMEYLGSEIVPLQKSQDNLIALMKDDLDLSDAKRGRREIE